MNGTDLGKIIFDTAAAAVSTLVVAAAGGPNNSAVAAAAAAAGESLHKNTFHKTAFFNTQNEEAAANNATTESESTPQDVVFGIALILSGGAFIYHNLSFLKLPYTVIMFGYGLIMGAIGTAMGHDSRFADIFSGLGTVSPELVFHIFLPILIFEGSYGMKTHAFWTIISFVLLLAGPGLLINMCFIGVALKMMYPLWNWYLAGLLGAVLSATDPVAVVALLKDLGVDKRMTAMVDGEAIMNDGTAIIMFTLLIPAAQVGYITDPWYSILWSCVRLTLGAAVFGWCVGWLTKIVLQRTHGNDLVQTCITISFAYMAFFSADIWFRTSGVLTLCFMGVYLATYMPTLFPGKEGSQLNTTWHFLVHFANTALFALVGIVIARDVFPYLEIAHLFKILILYAVATLARFAMILILKPTFVFNKNYKVGIREAMMLVHGGLRGGVSTMLALMIYHTHGIAEEDRYEVLILTSGIVMLTLAVNATTAQTVVALLGHRAKDQNRLLQMEIGLKKLQKLARTSLRETRLHPFFIGTNWEKVEEIVTQIKNPYEGVPPIRETEDRMFNVLLMRAFKTKVWAMRDGGNITEEAVRILTQATSKCIDKGKLITTKDLLPLMTYPTLLIKLYKHYFHRIPQQTVAGSSFASSFASPPPSGILPTNSLASPKHNNSPLTPNTSAPPAASPSAGGSGGTTTGTPYLNDDDIATSGSLSFFARYVLRWRLQVDMDFFAILIAYSAALDSLETIYKHYVLRPEHATMCEKWLEHESESIRAKIRAYSRKRPRTMCAFMTKSAGDLVVKDLAAGAEELHNTLGFALPAAHALVYSCEDIRLKIKKWPTQIDLVNNQQLLMRSELLKDFPIDLLRTLKAKVGEYTFKNGEEVSIGDCAGVVVLGVVESFGALERNRGPGDCFNVAPAVCNTVGVEYVVSSKTATILAVPYTMIKAGIDNKDSVYFRNTLLNLAVGEALAPAAKETLLHCRNSTIDQIAEQMAAGHGRLIIAPWNNFSFTPRAPKHEEAKAMEAVANAAGEDGADAAAAACVEHTPPDPAEELLKAIASVRREHLFFIAGSSFGNIHAIVHTPVGPCLIPNTVLGRFPWKKGTELFAFSIPDSENCVPLRTPINSPRNAGVGAGSGNMAARQASQRDLGEALDSNNAPLEIGDLNVHYGDALEDEEEAMMEMEMEMSPSRFFDAELRTLNSNKMFSPSRNSRGAGAGQQAGDDPQQQTASSTEGSGGAGEKDKNNSALVASASTNNNNDDEDAGGEGTDYASYVDLREILLSAAHRLATQYNPATSLTCIPYLNRLQLMFLSELEQLMNATWALHLEETGADPHAKHHGMHINNTRSEASPTTANATTAVAVLAGNGSPIEAQAKRKSVAFSPTPTGAKVRCATAISEARTVVAITTEKVLAFLQRFCTEGFSAEKMLYNRMVREAQRKEAAAPAYEMPPVVPHKNYSGLSHGNVSNDSLGGGGGATGATEASGGGIGGGESSSAYGSGTLFFAGGGSPRFRPISPRRNASGGAGNFHPLLPPMRSVSGGGVGGGGFMGSPPRKSNSYLLRRGVQQQQHIQQQQQAISSGGSALGGTSAGSTAASHALDLASALPPQILLSEEISILMARQREAHTLFVERVAAWRERMDHNEMCHDAVIDGMAAFAATHFKEDNLLCQIAASEKLFGYDEVAEMSYRGAIDPEKTGRLMSTPAFTTTTPTQPSHQHPAPPRSPNITARTVGAASTTQREFERPPLAAAHSSYNVGSGQHSPSGAGSITMGRMAGLPPLHLGGGLTSAAAIASTVPASSPLAPVISLGLGDDDEEEEIISETKVE